MFCIGEGTNKSYEDWGCFLFVQILSKFVNTSTKQAYFQWMFSQSLSKSLKSVSCTSLLYSLTLKGIYIGQSNEGKNWKKNIHGGHSFSLLDFLRINQPFC